MHVSTAHIALWVCNWMVLLFLNCQGTYEDPCALSSRRKLGQEGLGFYDGFEWDDLGVTKCLTWSLAIE